MKFGLVGEKLSHSFSPQLHKKIMDQCKIEGEYGLFEFEKKMKDNILEIMKKKVDGFNVTIPYKETVFHQVDYLGEESKKIGAINTVLFKDGKSYGYNTDYFGFIEMLRKNNISVKNKSCYILGSGGASKAVQVALETLGADEIIIVSRTPKVDGKIKMINYDDILRGDILINTTPIGMYPNINESPVDENIIKEFKVIVDIIYNPRETKLMKIARKNRLIAINGLDMLIEQGIKAQEIWQGKKLSINIDEI